MQVFGCLADGSCRKRRCCFWRAKANDRTWHHWSWGARSFETSSSNLLSFVWKSTIKFFIQCDLLVEVFIRIIGSISGHVFRVGSKLDLLYFYMIFNSFWSRVRLQNRVTSGHRVCFEHLYLLVYVADTNLLVPRVWHCHYCCMWNEACISTCSFLSCSFSWKERQHLEQSDWHVL